MTEHLAEQLWESRRQADFDDPPWPDAGLFWQTRFRELAMTAVASLRG